MLFRSKYCVEAAAEICRDLGYGVYVPPRETCGPVDMEVNGRKVQVKYRSRCVSNYNRVRLKTYLRPSVGTYSPEDVDVVVICIEGSWYVIPTNVMPTVGGRIRNALHMPDFAEWIDRWCVFDVGKVLYSMQKSFDF